MADIHHGDGSCFPRTVAACSGDGVCGGRSLGQLCLLPPLITT
ncbi:DUF4005 domain-containing protein [Psidium guajava]|nr:DUF4005 domain-containing protein [Psidium guajava]